MEKKQWIKPELVKLDINFDTSAGAGIIYDGINMTNYNNS